MKVVLDTNVLVSAFLFEKKLGAVVRLIEQGDVTPCFVVFTLQELRTVLSYPKFQPVLNRARVSAEEIMEQVRSHSITLDDPKIIPKVIRHLGDNYILAAAVAAKAECIVTGDAEILALKIYKGIPILTAQQFLAGSK